jgi:branched-chain amino acid transport system ATP-binding protein
MSLLRLDSISLKFGGLSAVDGVSFSIERGEIFTMIGPNGAGKTSIFNIISRFYEPSGGRIFFDDVEITGVPAHEIAGLGIARTFQNIELFANATVLDNLLVGRHIHRATSIYQDMLFLPKVRRAEYADRHRVEEIIDFFDLQRYREQLIANLPYGVRKVCEVARALCTEPKLLLLDEPSSGLNVEETEDMVYWINDIRSDLGITVLMVEHDMTLVNRVSDRVLALNYGQVLALGAPAAVARDPGVIAAYLGS